MPEINLAATLEIGSAPMRGDEQTGSAVGQHFAGTVVARNYVAFARVLHDSYVRHHPGRRFFTLIVDGDEGDRATVGVGEVVLPADLGIEPSELTTMKLVYSVMEFSTGLKPAFLMWMIRSGGRTATYIDPDIKFFSSIDDVFDLAYERGVVLTPHLLAPFPVDDRRITHAQVMHSGIYNLGFISVGPGAMKFLAWWHARLVLEGFVDLAQAQFTDQRWVDWAPSLTPSVVVKDPGLNAAYWNLHERRIAFDVEHGWRAGPAPLRFFHFSGYDPERPWLMSKHQGELPRILLSENPDLQALCDEYREELEGHGYHELRALKYALDVLPNGFRLTRELRAMCRAAFEDRRAPADEPPDPWEDTEAFMAWLTEPSLGPVHTRISRLHYTLWTMNADLCEAFPDPLGRDAERYYAWLRRDPDGRVRRLRAGVPRGVGARSGASRGKAAPLHRGGFSVIGYASAELGVGEAGRRVGAAVQQSGLPWEMVGISRGTESRLSHRSSLDVKSHPSYSNQILCVNADQVMPVAAAMGSNRPGVNARGYWFWELEEFPERFVQCFKSVAEVWVASEFCRAAIQPHTERTVRLMPLPVPRPQAGPRYSRQQLGMAPADATFITIFDHFSVLERKNPVAVIDAYRDAFSESDGANLIVKSINGHRRLEDREQVRRAAAGRRDITLIEDYMSSTQVQDLIAHSSCLVSLHRSEGYGINLVDAMARNVPTIATAYSGNLSFQDESNAFLVPWTRVKVGTVAPEYPSTATWAEPSIDAATVAMRAIVNDQARVERVVSNASARVDELSATALAERYLEALAPGLSVVEGE